MTDPIRAALERLHQYAETFPEHDREPAALVGEPTDAELLGLMPDQFRTDLATVSRLAARDAGTGVTPGLFRVSLNTGALEYARAVWDRARQGHQPAPPAAGEVGELVADELVRRLRTKAATEKSNRCHYSAILLTRAADILEQRHPAPVPVSERLPGPGDCDAEGRCWWWRTDDADEWWELLCISDAREYNAGCGNARYTHWLPATALPLPQQETPND